MEVGHAVETKARTLAEALAGADIFFGLSVKGALSPDMVQSMAPKPIIFAMANPDPGNHPRRRSHAVRDDAIVATGRSDYPNQINNVLGFPYIFRGALDVRARAINMEMKIAAAQALAELAREDVPDEVAAAYGGAAALRARLHHPGAVRSAADLQCSAGGRQSRDGDRCGAPADRRHGGLPGAARSRRDPAAGALQRVFDACAASEAGGLRRGRGGAGDPRRAAFVQQGSAPRSWSAARSGCARRRRARRRPRRRHRDPQRAPVDAQRRLCGIPVRAAAAAGLSAARLPAPDQSGPQPFAAAWWRSATPTRW